MSQGPDEHQRERDQHVRKPTEKEGQVASAPPDAGGHQGAQTTPPELLTDKKPQTPEDNPPTDYFGHSRQPMRSEGGSFNKVSLWVALVGVALLIALLIALSL